MIEVWTDAYSNAPIIQAAETYPDRWAAAAAAFRQGQGARAKLDLAYGHAQRQRLDLFWPDGAPEGLAVFVHGGYWMNFDKSWWSHLAAGPLQAGWAVAVPSYSLAPEARIARITAEIGQAVAAAADWIDGPIRLGGHSAGGHLVSRMICEGAPIDAAVQARIAHVLSISGLHDLRPLLRTELNQTLGLTEAEAVAESAALHRPTPGASLTAWVGAAERPEFRRQTDLIANIWTGLGAETRAVHDTGRHHFDVVAGLADPSSPISRALVGSDGF